MLRGYATLASGGQMHYRIAGSGPPVVLLHPSPLSSRFCVPMALRLSKHFTAIAVDTPGYGQSDPLPGDPRAPRLEDYVPAYREFLDAMRIDKAALYGNATGAEIAHLFAHAHPERTAVCMMDTAGHREDAELDAMLEGYFPDTTPKRDGSHLMTLWHMVSSLNLYSPWHSTLPEHRINRPLPPVDVIQATFMDYAMAGPHYAAAYRPAFYTAKHSLITRVKVPATLTRWQGKPDLAEQDELIRRGLPPNFTVLHAGPSVEERQRVAEEYLLRNYLPAGVSPG
jgi:pimeloyl-ACP methyl ester carboxylesterase